MIADPHRFAIRLLGILLGLIVAVLLCMPHPAGATPRPCVGAVVRRDIAGVEIVRQSSGKLCARPAGKAVQR